jgi:hypothetical protein
MPNSLSDAEKCFIICAGVMIMQLYLGDIGVLFTAILIILYMMWDKLFHEND